MRLRVTDSMYRQLAELRGSLAAPKGGVMQVPRRLSIEEWEAQAEPHQRDLMEWSMTTHGGAHVREPAPEAMTADQERAFLQDVETTKRQRKPMTEEQRAAYAYAKAIGLYR